MRPIKFVSVMFMAFKRYIIARVYITIYKIQDTSYHIPDTRHFYLQVST